MNRPNSVHQNRHMHTENPSLMFLPVSDIYVDLIFQIKFFQLMSKL